MQYCYANFSDNMFLRTTELQFNSVMPYISDVMTYFSSTFEFFTVLMLFSSYSPFSLFPIIVLLNKSFYFFKRAVVILATSIYRKPDGTLYDWKPDGYFWKPTPYHPVPVPDTPLTGGCFGVIGTGFEDPNNNPLNPRPCPGEELWSKPEFGFGYIERPTFGYTPFLNSDAAAPAQDAAQAQDAVAETENAANKPVEKAALSGEVKKNDVPESYFAADGLSLDGILS
jgi:hypothetical protein